MQLIPETNSIDSYLESSDVIDFFNPKIQIVAEDLRRGRDDEVDLVRSCYEWVRDNVCHSFDINGITVTCTASEVLQMYRLEVEACKKKHIPKGDSDKSTIG